ncbi:MAG: O-antigen ligase family protein [Maribacter arcticus]|uniref:O-antigen ligase family protein n=1 Tax=Maribacter arcticus TaxID=561365 RepID=UPI003001DABA
MKERYIIAIIILSIFLVPTFNIGGLPIRFEDLIFISILFSFKKQPDLKNLRIFYIILIFLTAFSLLSLFIQILKGYIPVLGDINSLFSLVRNIVIFYAGSLIGNNLKIKSENLIKILSIGFFISAIASLIQYFDLGGIGQELFLIYGKEKELEYGLSRAIGTLGNPNYAAFFQVNAFIALLVLKRNKSVNSIVSIILLLIIITSVFVTFSRTGLICIILLFLFNLLLEKKYLSLALISFVVFATSPIISSLSRNTRYGSLFESTSSGNGTDIFTLNGRIDGIWMEKFDRFINNPLLGIGSAKGLRSNTEFDIITFDNSFLYIIVTSGIIGFFLYFIFYYNIIKIFTRKIRSYEESIIIYILLLHVNILVFYFTTDLIIVVEFTTFYFFTVGIFLNHKKNDQTLSLNSNIKLE